jgi:DNA repair protein RadC
VPALLDIRTLDHIVATSVKLRTFDERGLL